MLKVILFLGARVSSVATIRGMKDVGWDARDAGSIPGEHLYSIPVYPGAGNELV